MLSQKLQDDLMTAYQKVYEEKRGHAAGSDDTEKQASQLASDVRYKAKGKVPEGATEEERRKIFLQILSASPAPAVVKSMAKEKLLGEEVVGDNLKEAGAMGAVMKLNKASQAKKAAAAAKRSERIQGIKNKVLGRTTAGKMTRVGAVAGTAAYICLLYTSPSPRD